MNVQTKSSDETISPFEWRFLEYIESLGKIGAEGFQIRVSDNFKSILKFDYHHTYEIYDLASLTKIIFTVHEMMRLFDEGRYTLEQSVQKILPWYPFPIAIGELLNHTSGLKWWVPFYQEMPRDLSPVFRRLWLQSELRHYGPESGNDKESVGKKGNETKGTITKRSAVYSDLNFLVLGYLIEELRQKPLFRCFEDLKSLGSHGEIHFRPIDSNQAQQKSIAPTEKCPWRKKVLRGEVHDDNTWALGGVSSHAGLFGSCDDVDEWGNQLLRAYWGLENKFGVTTKTVRRFTRRSLVPSLGDWGLGFMLPTAGSCSGGEFLSSQSFGHTGFTGVSLWIDPKINRVITLLSNRVHPSREDRTFISIRPKIHNGVWLSEKLPGELPKKYSEKLPKDKK